MNTATTLDMSAVAGAIAFFVPLLVSIITKRDASDGVKAAAAVAGAVAAAVIALWTNPGGGPITTSLVINTILVALVTQIAAYKSVWQHSVSPVLANATANFGLGKVVKGEVIDR